MLDNDVTQIIENLGADAHRFSGKTVLLSGGAGFLGSHLCETLLSQGHEILCVDNFYTGRKANVISLLKNPHFEIVRHDVTFPLYVEVDEIYNLACPASPGNVGACSAHGSSVLKAARGLGRPLRFSGWSNA